MIALRSLGISALTLVMVLAGYVTLHNTLQYVAPPTSPDFVIAQTHIQPTEPDTSAVVALQLPNSDHALPIVDGARAENGNWHIPTRAIAHWKTTPQPGEKGNSVIYGHNWPSLLGSLHTLKPGQELRTTTANGTQRVFIIESVRQTIESDTQPLQPTSEPTLTLYTCVSVWESEKRIVVQARLTTPEIPSTILSLEP